MNTQPNQPPAAGEAADTPALILARKLLGADFRESERAMMEAEAARLIDQHARNRPAVAFTGQDLIDALEQLNRSERGHAAAVQFRKLLEAGDRYALGLDTENWRALENLVKACRVFGGHKILEFLPKR